MIKRRRSIFFYDLDSRFINNVGTHNVWITRFRLSPVRFEC